MELMADENGILRQYLLGLLPPDQRTPLEERLLTESAFYEELSIAEDELIDRYLAGDLTNAEREGFETHFLLAPERRLKLRFARALRRYIAAEPVLTDQSPEETLESTEQPSSALPHPAGKWNLFKLLLAPRPVIAFTWAAVVVVVLVSLFVVGRLQTRHEPRSIYAVTLMSGLVRESGELKRITIPHDADTLRLRLVLPSDDYPAYRAEFQTAESRVIHTSDNLKARDVEGSRAVETDVPSETLAAGDYQVRLSGLNSGGDAEPVSRYYLRITDR